MAARLGFIGLGIMGRPMASRLARQYEVHGFDVDPTRLDGLAGVQAAESAAEVARKCSLVCLSLPSTSIVEQVVLGSAGESPGLKETLPPGALLIDLSTTEPRLSMRISDELKAKGIDFMDAPVSGGEKGAIDGSLSIMVGADPNVFEKGRPILELLGDSIVRVGEVGSGGVAKLVNNMIVGAEFAVIAEGFAVAARCGVPASVLFEAIRGGWAGSKVLEVSAAAMIKRDFRPGGTVGILSKDLGSARSLARELCIPVPVTAAVDEVFTAAKACGKENLAQPSIIQMWEKLLHIDTVEGKHSKENDG